MTRRPAAARGTTGYTPTSAAPSSPPSPPSTASCAASAPPAPTIFRKRGWRTRSSHGTGWMASRPTGPALGRMTPTCRRA
uniref:Uncharacterized protein n=1 Tax=Arundo donax TaxID=35708 RepID=A0A0A9FRL1_ARUDO